MTRILTQFQPAWNQDSNVTFNIDELLTWEESLDGVVESIKNQYSEVVDNSGFTWQLSKIEKYQGFNSDCEFDWLIIARYIPIK